MNDVIDPNATVENFGEVTIGTESKQEVDEFREKSGGSEYLSRIQLMAPNAKLVNREDNPCTKGHFYLVGNGDPVDLGKKVDIVIMEYRFKSLRWNNDTAEESFDEDSDLYKETKEAADEGRSREKGDKWDYSWGPEFLVWVSDQGEFAYYYMGGKSARISASKEIYPLWKGKDRSVANQTISSQWHEGKYNAWYLHKSIECSTAPANVPTEVETQKQINLFKNPPVREVVEESDSDAR